MCEFADVRIWWIGLKKGELTLADYCNLGYFRKLFMNIESIKQNPVVKMAFEFALDIVNYCELLEKEKKYIVARQLFKSGTSIGASVTEAQNAESKADFIHKFKVAAKEGEETQYWLLICSFAKQYPSCTALLQKIEA